MRLVTRPAPDEAMLLGRIHLSDLAWVALVGYELLCPREETLSDGIHRRVGHPPLLIEVLVAYTALHLLGRLHPRIDVYFQATKLFGRLLGRAAVDALEEAIGEVMSS